MRKWFRRCAETVSAAGQNPIRRSTLPYGMVSLVDPPPTPQCGEQNGGVKTDQSHFGPILNTDKMLHGQKKHGQKIAR